MFALIPYPQLRLFFDGMLCMMALYALLSYTQHRKPIYWQYALYILCMIVTFYWDDIDYGKTDYLPGTNFKVAAVESLAFLLYIRFAILLIDIPRLDPFSHRILKIMSIILAIEIGADLAFYLLDVSNDLKSNSYILFRCILSFGALVVVPRILKLREVAVGYFIAGSFFFVLGCLVALATNFMPSFFNLNPANALTFPVTFMEFGVILEVLCFTLGMSVQNRRNELEKIEAQEQLIEQLLENEKKQSTLLRIRDDISRDIHDELGADLSSISAMSYAAIKQLNGSGAEQTITIIGETSRKVIARMREIVWSLHSAHDSVENFSFRAKETAYTLLEHHPIALHLELPSEEVDFRIPAEHRRNLFLVYKEILHNIVRHSKAQNVHIRLYVHDNYLNLIVKDDGIGFVNNASKSHGNGLLNLKQRTSAFAGIFSLESLPGEGTTVTVGCPLDMVKL
ncbi:sensor histidine kinase [Dyadobacter sp. CY312]|uniref:sensor histidine kinase n=1 Tax=Dyadobacter sp. CY312 TaxID=2907303 RepID=UPI001F2D53F1|nr:sensor histidine kinase [Dyadobacter sp. CY312]MCE7044175.1 sensor histidine kinase [Dyadobacter sp. CY312]